MRPDVLRPGLTCCNRAKLRISSPAPINRATESATSATVSAARIRRLPVPEVEPRESARSASCGFCRAAWIAGRSPNAIIVVNATPSPKASTVPSIDSSSRRGTDSGPSATRRRTAANEMATPIPAASTAIRHDSNSS
jgi:hypothetical protein